MRSVWQQGLETLGGRSSWRVGVELAKAGFAKGYSAAVRSEYSRACHLAAAFDVNQSTLGHMNVTMDRYEVSAAEGA